jgi:5,5'-dehydrodivanillate O-demethylase oxygenase subunit
MFEPSADGSLIDETEDPPVEYLAPYKDPPDAIHPVARYNLRSVLAQDHMAWETQGPIADRTVEHLSYSDRGIALFRNVTREQIERVQQGLDPMGVIRDPDHPMIDTNIDESTKVEGVDRPVGIAASAEVGGRS